MLPETLDGIDFLLFLPFLVIDLVVASNLMSMGMMMLPGGRGLPALQADRRQRGATDAARAR